MHLAHKMEYRHPVDQKSSIEMIPYTPDFQQQYRFIYNECYHEMRKALGIKPYDFIQDDSFFQTGMNQVYLYIHNNELMGSVALKGEEIDDLIISPKYQGQGFGKKILIWALEHMESKEICLHVAHWNQRAIKLYQTNGFVITETFEI